MTLSKLYATAQPNLVKRELSGIYAPIQEDLALVEDMLISAGKGDTFSLIDELSCSLKDNDEITHLLSYSLNGGGKRLRPALTLLSGKFGNYNLDQLLMMATAIEILHTATLVHDDVIDRAALRRGKPTINAIYDNDKAILLGDYLLAKAGYFVSNTQNLRVIKLFVQNLLVICGGELTQNFSVFDPGQTRPYYLSRIASKTASLLSLATESGAILSEAPESTIRALKNYGYYLGITFQIIDDILDFVGNEVEMGKPVGSDLAQGILTLPAMILLERYPYNNPIRDLQDGDRKKNVERVMEIVREDSSIIEECYSVASDYSKKACCELESLSDNSSRESLINLAEYAVIRGK